MKYERWDEISCGSWACCYAWSGYDSELALHCKIQRATREPALNRHICWSFLFVIGRSMLSPPLKNGAGGIFVFGSVLPRVPKTLWTPYLENQWRDFRPILVTDAFWFIDALIRFWNQKVKGQGHSGQWPEKPCEHRISNTNEGNFAQFW